MDISIKKTSLIRTFVFSGAMLLATVNVAYSHEMYDCVQYHRGDHHMHCVKHHYHHGRVHYYGWRDGATWYRANFLGIGIGPAVVTYPNGCVWVPEHRNRYGYWVPGHRAC